MSDLLRTSLVRSARSSLSPTNTYKDPKVEEYDPLSRATQISEVIAWIKELVPQKSFGSDGSLADKIVESLSLPSVRIFKRILSYSDLVMNPSLHHLVENESSYVMLGVFFWLICSSSFDQFLALILGLYDISDDYLLGRETAIAIFSDIFLEDLHEENQVTDSKALVQVYEIVDEIFRYAEAKNIAVSKNQNEIRERTGQSSKSSLSEKLSNTFKFLKSTKSLSGKNSLLLRTSTIFKQASNVFKRSVPPEGTSTTGIDCVTFVKFFKKKKQCSILWPLRVIQEKLQEAILGQSVWIAIHSWLKIHNILVINPEGLSLRSILSDIEGELIIFYSKKRLLDHQPHHHLECTSQSPVTITKSFDDDDDDEDFAIPCDSHDSSHNNKNGMITDTVAMTTEIGEKGETEQQRGDKAGDEERDEQGDADQALEDDSHSRSSSYFDFIESLYDDDNRVIGDEYNSSQGPSDVSSQDSHEFSSSEPPSERMAPYDKSYDKPCDNNKATHRKKQHVSNKIELLKEDTMVDFEYNRNEKDTVPSGLSCKSNTHEKADIEAVTPPSRSFIFRFLPSFS